MPITTLFNPGTVVLSPYKLARVVLRTSNFDAMRAFCKTFLDGHAIFEDENPLLSNLRLRRPPHRDHLHAAPLT